MNRNFYQRVQLRTRAARITVSRIEDESRTADQDVFRELLKARQALQDAEEIAAIRLADLARAA